MSRFRNPLSAVVAIIALGLPVFSLVGQEVKEQIEIINQDGQPLNANQFKFHMKPQKDGTQGKAGIKVDDGKIIILNEDGTTREIDVTGAKSIIVNQSVKSIIKDGEEQKQVQGKAVIIGPNGDKQEIIIGDGGLEGDLDGIEVDGLPEMLGKLQFDLPPFGPHKFRAFQSNFGKYMIGIHCTPISEGLRDQLDLAEGTGLIVESEPDANTPAGKAGIMKHDILMYADQTELKTLKDLTDVIQAAGTANSAISLTIIRRGKELGIDVTPVERPAGEPTGFKFIGPPDGDLNIFKFDEAGPGFIFGGGQAFNEHLQKQVEEMQQQMKKHLEQMNELQRQMENFGNPDKDR